MLGGDAEVSCRYAIGEGAGGDADRAGGLGRGMLGEVEMTQSNPVHRAGLAGMGQHEVALAQGLDGALAVRRRDQGSGDEAGAVRTEK